MSLKRILIVDDEPDITSTFKIALKDNGFEEVDVYNDPFLALQNFKSGVYGLIILDVAMPKIDGIKLYQEMKKTDDAIKAFFVTTFKVNYHILRDLFSAGGVDIKDESIAAILADTGGRFLRKPVETYELVKRVKAELEKKRICKYCGWDLDEPDSDILSFFHSGCWKEYRKDGLLDPMPENFW
jgi:CheY-like chemotaxis protein